MITVHRSFVAATLALASCLAGCASSSPAPVANTSAPAGSYAFWPAFPVEPRIQFVRSFASSQDVAPVKNSGFDELVFGKESTNAAEVNKPYGVAMRNGRIYVTDIRASAVVVFDLVKKQTRLIGTSGANRLANPVAVAVADDGTLYVADSERGAVLVFDPAERYSHAMGFPKFKPSSLAVSGDRLYATDMAGQNVVFFDRRSGKQLGAFGTVGDSDGQFRLPLGVAADRAGNIFVMDMMRCRLQKFSPEGVFLAGVGEMGDSAGTFARPKHIAVDSDGIIYVVDAAFQNVQMFDAELRLLLAFGAAGNHPGAMNLPAGVCVSDADAGLFTGQIHPGFEPQRLILVTNQFGPSKVSVYALGKTRAGYTAADLAKSAAAVASGVGSDPETLKFQEQGIAGTDVPEEGAETNPAAPTTPTAPTTTPQAPPK